MESGVLPALAFRFCASVVRQKDLGVSGFATEVIRGRFCGKTRRLETLCP